MTFTDARKTVASCYPGWAHLILPLIDKCEADRVEIFDIKEKFGGLRFLLDLPATHTMDHLITKAERLSLTTCEVCGEPSVMRHKGNWLMTRCDKCWDEEKEDK